MPTTYNLGTNFIYRLSFGEFVPTQVNPLDNYTFSADQLNIMRQYYTQIVPMRFGIFKGIPKNIEYSKIRDHFCSNSFSLYLDYTEGLRIKLLKSIISGTRR